MTQLEEDYKNLKAKYGLILCDLEQHVQALAEAKATIKDLQDTIDTMHSKTYEADRDQRMRWDVLRTMCKLRSEVCGTEVEVDDVSKAVDLASRALNFVVAGELPGAPKKSNYEDTPPNWRKSTKAMLELRLVYITEDVKLADAIARDVPLYSVLHDGCEDGYIISTPNAAGGFKDRWVPNTANIPLTDKQNLSYERAHALARLGVVVSRDCWPVARTNTNGPVVSLTAMAYIDHARVFVECKYYEASGVLKVLRPLPVPPQRPSASETYDWYVVGLIEKVDTSQYEG